MLCSESEEMSVCVCGWFFYGGEILLLKGIINNPCAAGWKTPPGEDFYWRKNKKIIKEDRTGFIQAGRNLNVI